MAIPLRNTIYDKIKEAGSLTDVELYKILVKFKHILAIKPQFSFLDANFVILYPNYYLFSEIR